MSSLDSIFLKHGTDKGSNHHNYSPTYQRFLEPLRNSTRIVVELGIGGYEYKDRGGAGLRSWKEYFQNATIHGIDIYDKSRLEEDRISTYICSQDDEEHLNNIIDSIGDPDVIIDDASHHSDLCIKSWEILFPRLKKGGIYIVEDTETSYWEEISITGEDFKGGTHPNTTMNYFKRLPDHVNHKKNSYKDLQLNSISFYPGLIIIEKSK